MSMHQVNSNQHCFQHELADLVALSNPYYVELPLASLDEQGSTLDALIHLTFDTLNVQHLDLRILADAD